MLLKYYLLLFLVISATLQAEQQPINQNFYESRKNIKQTQRTIELQKRNLRNMQKTLLSINKKNTILKELTNDQRDKLVKMKNNLKKTKIFLKKEKEDLADTQLILNTKIETLKQQKELLHQKLKKISTANKKLNSVNTKVNIKETELDKLRQNISEQQAILKSKDELINSKNNYIFLAIIALVIFIFIFIIIHKIRKREQQTLIKLEELTENLEQKIIDGVERQKILERQKSSSMNEMIGNIAHQWRQPLNVISATCTHITLKATINNTIDIDLLNSELTKISDNSQYLSKTIDTFRDYIKGGKSYEELTLQDELKQAILISSSALKANYITLLDNIDYDSPIKIKLVKSELPQVIINILNNAKDAIVQNKIKNPKIELNLIKKLDKIIITIEDNAGGIPQEVMHKIFEPYFTTKHKSKGTGLGLNMSYKIITQSLNGKIYAQNTDIGAKFFIELPFLD